jgi:hypothetical protein
MTAARLAVVAAAIASSTLLAQAPPPKPAPAPARPPQDVSQLAWFAGCWQIVRGEQVIEEQWMAPSGGVMLAMSRTVREGRTTAMEFVTLRVVDGRIVYEANPSGQGPVGFAASFVSADRAVFENPTHDYPRRITYERKGADAISAWIDDGTGSRRIEYPFQRVACPGSRTS